jgi:hypothetical protein
MNKTQCKQCKKVIEGYSVNHVNYLLSQHELTHRKKQKTKAELNGVDSPDARCSPDEVKQ